MPPRSASRAPVDAPPDAALLDTREVAAYLRLKERRIYDLVRQNAIPHLRATGKLLFPRADIDAWLASKSTAAPRAAARPPIVAGSHDPLLECALRESRCGLAVLACGSRAGLQRLAAGEATVAAVHWRDEATGVENLPLLQALLTDADVVALEWCRRTQGLILAPGNPLKIRGLADLVRRKARVVPRQADAGSRQLLELLLAAAGVDADRIAWLDRAAPGESDLADAIAQGRADAGFGIEAAARALGLDFLPLARERLDLVATRRDAFEPPLQALFAFARTPEFAEAARRLGGYDVTFTGRVSFNG